MLSTALCARVSAANTIEKVPAFIELTFQWRGMKKLAKPPFPIMLS